MPSAVYLHDGEQQITVTFRKEEDRERFKAHYRAIDALGVRWKERAEQAEADVARLRDILAPMLRVSSRFIAYSEEHGIEHHECLLCGAESDNRRTLEHSEWCPVSRALAALATSTADDAERGRGVVE